MNVRAVNKHLFYFSGSSKQQTQGMLLYHFLHITNLWVYVSHDSQINASTVRIEMFFFTFSIVL